MWFIRYTPQTGKSAVCVVIIVNVKDRTVSSCPGCRWARCCCEMLFVTQMPTTRSHMHCDRVEDGSVDRLGDRLRRREHSSGQDEREARYWTKELYDFEANDPDRWGHSGFKELYPEEFKSDWERDRGDDQNGHCRKKNTKSRLKTAKSKHLKKSSKKKKKKKKKKEEKRTGESDGESSSDSVKQKRKSSKSKHKRKKSEREEESSSEERGRRRKRQMDSHRDSGPESHKKRKNWKAGEDKSEDSSED
ncbi:uncharacterized protein NKAPD1 isoform X2 [Salvelinus sp. IW2-2015]|uniref:uncharacterized protein NKAPD1 isoform X2 n=1 Tax=Salvelinus sp. IW2-2015 TaxID=2691554 RepID=UPI0038D43BC0